MTGWEGFFVLFFFPEKPMALSWSTLGLHEVIEWDTGQDQQAANLLIAAWLSEPTLVFGFLGHEGWPCM